MLILSLKSISKQSTRVIYSKRRDAYPGNGWGRGMGRMMKASRRSEKTFNRFVPLGFSFHRSRPPPRCPSPSFDFALGERNLLAYYIESNHGTDLINCTPRKNNARPSSPARVMNVNPEIKLAIKERSDGWSRFKRMKLIACPI